MVEGVEGCVWLVSRGMRGEWTREHAPRRTVGETGTPAMEVWSLVWVAWRAGLRRTFSVCGGPVARGRLGICREMHGYTWALEWIMRRINHCGRGRVGGRCMGGKVGGEHEGLEVAGGGSGRRGGWGRGRGVGGGGLDGCLGIL